MPSDAAYRGELDAALQRADAAEKELADFIRQYSHLDGHNCIRDMEAQRKTVEKQQREINEWRKMVIKLLRSIVAVAHTNVPFTRIEQDQLHTLMTMLEE